MGLRKQRCRSAPDTEMMLSSGEVEPNQHRRGQEKGNATMRDESLIIITVIITLMSKQTLSLHENADDTTGPGSVVVQL